MLNNNPDSTFWTVYQWTNLGGNRRPSCISVAKRTDTLPGACATVSCPMTWKQIKAVSPSMTTDTIRFSLPSSPQLKHVLSSPLRTGPFARSTMIRTPSTSCKKKALVSRSLNAFATKHYLPCRQCLSWRNRHPLCRQTRQSRKLKSDVRLTISSSDSLFFDDILNIQ